MALKAKVSLLAYCLDSEGEIYHSACQNWVWLWEKSHSNNTNCLPPLMSSNYKYLGISKYLRSYGWWLKSGLYYRQRLSKLTYAHYNRDTWLSSVKSEVQMVELYRNSLDIAYMELNL